MFILITVTSLVVHANEKLDQVYQNAKNASYNFELWKNNSAVAQENINSITKALEENRELQKKWKSNSEKLQSKLAELDKAEQKFLSQIREEEKLLSQEQAQIKELEKLIAEIKSQHEKRKENLTNAQKLKETYAESRKSLTRSLDEQNRIRDQLVAQEQTLVRDGNEWAKKKQESDRNVVKWKQLSEYHTKLKNNYERLAAGKE
jgi:chromosome segregation ATPase